MMTVPSIAHLFFNSPKDHQIVVTLEQIMPYQWDTEFGIKKPVYDALK